MDLTISRWFASAHLEYFGAASRLANRHARRLAPVFLALPMLVTAAAAHAQQASQPAYDPRQFDQRFNGEQLERTPAGQPRLPMPRLARSATPPADPTPLFVLRHISIVGATAIPRDQLATAYRPYIGRKVSQADLAAIAAGISDIYRVAGFHLS